MVWSSTKRLASELLVARWRRSLAVLAGWTALAIFFSIQNYLLLKQSIYPVSFAHAIVVGLTDWYLWALFALVIMWSARRFPISHPRIGRVWAAHVPLAFITAYAHLTIYLVIHRILFPRPHRAGDDFWTIALLRGHLEDVDWGSLLAPGVLPNTLTYFCIVFAAYAWQYYRVSKERELQLARVQLQALKVQLHPHFLFNALHAVLPLMEVDKGKAGRVVMNLSDMLRFSLDNVGVQEVPLSQELEFTRKYLEIESTRFAERLRIDIEVAPGLNDAVVPCMVLQPLVENSIRHGISRYSGLGIVRVCIHREGTDLHLEVTDNGAGFPLNRNRVREGIGLGATRARLEGLYGPQHHFEVGNIPGGGARVRIVLPFRNSN